MRGFTLVEILVSVTVLTLIVGMMGSMLVTMGQLWHDAQKRVNNFTKARAMLDMMTHDLQAGIYRSDLSAFPDLSAMANSPKAFYTQRTGIGASARDVSLVGYSLNTTTLQRSSQAITWSDVLPALNSATTLGTPQDTATGVVDYKLVFLYKNGTLSPTYNPTASNPVRAVGITLAVVDDQTLQVLNATSMSQLNSDLEQRATLTRSVKADWEDYLKSASMIWSNYPKGLGVGLKVFERYVYLPSSS